MIICGLIFIGAVLGFGGAALWFHKQRDELDSVKQALRQANAATSAANDIIATQRVQMNIQQQTIDFAKSELQRMADLTWPMRERK